MRAGLTPDDVRAAGIYLNGGRRRGWKKRLAELLDTPEATVAAWATRSAGNARPIPGVAAVAIRLLVALLRHELMTTAAPERAAEALATRLSALTRQPELFPSRRELPIELGRPEPPVVLPPGSGIAPPAAKLIGVRRGRTLGGQAEDERLTVPDAYLLPVKSRPGGSRKPQ